MEMCYCNNMYLYAFTDNLEVVRVQISVHNCPYNSKWVATEEEVGVDIQG